MVRKRLAAAICSIAFLGVVGSPVQAEPSACTDQVAQFDATAAAVPSELRSLIDSALADDRLRGVGLGLSLWVEGYGVVTEVNPSLRLRPASTQKLLVAASVFEVLSPEQRLRTLVMTDGIAASGVLHGDLYLVGGGDPTLTVDGPHSLSALAAAVRAAGIRQVRGNVIGDETRYDSLRTVATWSEGVTPAWVGSLSALMVDENRFADAPAIAQPALVNASAFRRSLEDAGVAVEGLASSGRAPASAVVVASTESARMDDLVSVMLTDSNNTYAEMLVKEIGFRSSGVGSTAAGVRAMARVAADLCLPDTVLQQDGSGLSHGNARSVASWRLLLQSVRDRNWDPYFEDALAVAGETGTLRFRFRDSAAAGNLRAKTGTITGIRALSGYLTTADGRTVVFSAVVDDDEPRPAMRAIDDLLVVLAGYGA